jgi:hypothetical protein
MKRKMFLVATLGAAVMAGSLFASCEKEKSEQEKGKEAGVALCDCMTKAAAAADTDPMAVLACLSYFDATKMPNISITSDEVDVTKLNEYEKGFIEGAQTCAETLDGFSVLRK